MRTYAVWVVLILSAATLTGREEPHVTLRSRVHLFRTGDEWSEVRADYRFNPAKSAVIVCDMWDKHWCTGANVRVAALVKRLEPLLEAARTSGMIVVHAPSDTMAYYANAPQRERILLLPRIAPPEELQISAALAD